VAETNGAPSLATSVDDVVDVLRASSAYDLTVVPGLHHDLLDHGLQTAAILRSTHPGDFELQVAGLVHDIGHTLGPRRDDVHAEVAASFVLPVMGERVAELVRLHVPAKRYLVTTEPRYRDGLDEGSRASLENQGGSMSSDEILAFEDEPFGADAVVLRRADEAGKVPGRAVPGLEAWLSPLRSHNFRLSP
jgi:predicted HD phosphohydrolase